MTQPRSIVLVHGVQSSHLTWWRIQQDLADLGWAVRAVDLLGHGSRAAVGPAALTLEDLARDLLEQVPEPVDVLAGHSLGALASLTAAALSPDVARRVVVEDPPGLAGAPVSEVLVTGLEEDIRTTRADPVATRRALLEDHPVWSGRDAENSVQNRLALDVDRVARFLRSERWDLPELVGRCPVPVHLLVATADSALREPDRSALLERLPAGHVAVIESGHTIHRERPGLWLHHVLRFVGAA